MTRLVDVVCHGDGCKPVYGRIPEEQWERDRAWYCAEHLDRPGPLTVEMAAAFAGYSAHAAQAPPHREDIMTSSQEQIAQTIEQALSDEEERHSSVRASIPLFGVDLPWTDGCGTCGGESCHVAPLIATIRGLLAAHPAALSAALTEESS